MSINDPNSISGGDGTISASSAKDRLAADMSGVKQTAKSDIEAIKTEASTQVDALKAEAGEQIDELKSQAKDQIHDATDKAKTFAGEQKDLAAGQLTGIASALGRVADELQADQSAIAGYTRQIADGIDRFADTVKTRPVDDIVNTAQDFGRKQPVAFLGAAALAGFVASRFIAASAHRSSDQTCGRSRSAENSTGQAQAPAGVYTAPSGLDAAPRATTETGASNVQR